MFFAKQHHKKGFTLAETILVVAIIAILLAVAAPNVLAYYRQLKLTGLDDDAKTIFMAAQSRLTAMLSAGEELKPSGTPTTSFGEGSYTETPTAAGGAAGPKVNFWYIDTDYSDLHNYVPGGSIESQLQDNKFVVEFNPDTGAVYAVWYWESDNDKFTYTSNYYKTDIERDTRLDKMVGYYGGSEVDRPELKQMPIPQLSLINAEELRLEIRIPTVTLPAGSGFSSNNIRVKVLVNGTEIISDTELMDSKDNDFTTKERVGRVILDTLKSGYDKSPVDDVAVGDWTEGWVAGAKFKDWVDNKSISAVPGDDINVTVVVSYVGTVTIDSKETSLVAQSASVSTNSLFAGLEPNEDTINHPNEMVAQIAYGRHLQNLHDSTGSLHPEFCSGVSSNEKITSAKQIRDINFAANVAKSKASDPKDTIYYWGDTYGNGTITGYDDYDEFHPISNGKISKFDGGGVEIRNIRIEGEGGSSGDHSGLFSFAYNDMEFDRVTVVNPHIHAHTQMSNVGALIGYGANVVIDQCKVYVEYDDGKDWDDLKNKIDSLFLNDLKIETNASGQKYATLLEGCPHLGAPEDACAVGGFIGDSYANVTISNSFCSIAIVGSRYVGGLVGKATENFSTGAKVKIDNSYSASFIYGNRYTAGLIGLTDNNVTIHNCYTAGEIKNGFPEGFCGAGLFNHLKDMSYDVSGNYAAVKYISITGAPVEPEPDTQADLEGTSVVFGTYKEDALTNNNYYIADPDVTFGYGHYDYTNKSDTVSCGNEVSAAELITKFTGKPGWTEEIAEMANGARTAAAGSSTFTHPYRLLTELEDLPDIYPYPMLVTTIKDVVKEDGTTADASLPMAHYGDWVEGEDTPSATMVYYEFTGTSSASAGGKSAYGFYKDDDGNFKTTPTGRLQSGEGIFVIEDGYALSYPTGTNMDQIPDKVKIDSTEYDVDKTDVFDIGGNTLYRIKGLDKVARDRYYHEVEVPTDNNPTTPDVTVFWFNPDLACEVFPAKTKVDASGNVVVDEAAPTEPKAKPETEANTEGVALVRSARQLAQLGINTNAGTGDYTKLLRGLKYEQEMDIDFNEYNQYDSGKEVKMPEIKDKATSPTYYNHVPVTLVGENDTVRAEYNGNGHKVINMLPGAIVADGLAENGMFAKVKYADISGIEIINGRVVTNGKDNGVMGDGSSSSGPADDEWIEGDKHQVTSGDITEFTNAEGSTNNRVSDTVGGYFTFLWGNSSKNEHRTSGGGDKYNGKTYNYRLSFNGTPEFDSSGSDEPKRAVKFAPNGPVKVNIVWRCGKAGENRQVAIYNKKGTQVTPTDDTLNLAKDEFYISEFIIDQATLSTYGPELYIGSLKGNNYIYEITVTELTPKNPGSTSMSSTPTEKPDGADMTGAKVRAGMLAGIVDNSTVTGCGVYVDYTGYDPTGKQPDAYDYYIVENGFGEDDYVGGLIGNVTESSVSSSYSAVKVLGVTYVGGFAGRLAGSTKDTVIEDCYSGGHTDGGTYYTKATLTAVQKTEPMKNVSATSEKNTGVGGFVGLVSKGGKVCFKGVNYTTSSVAIEKAAVGAVMGPINEKAANDPQVNYMTTGTSIGVFIGRVEYGAQIDVGTGSYKAINYATGTLFAAGKVVKRNATVKFPKNSSKEGYDWDESGKKWEKVDEASVQYVTADEEYINEKVTMLDPRTAAAGSTDVDDSYDDLGDVYPYMRAGHVLGDTSKEIVHHGDWTNRLDFIYYEVYYPASSDPADVVNIDESTTGADIQKYIDDGTIGIYGMLRGQADPVNTLRHDDSIVYDSGYMVVNVDKDDLGPVDIQLRSVYTKEGENNKNHYNSEMIMESKRITSAKASWANYVYIVPFSVLNIAPSDHYYMMVYVNGVTYVFNPHFAGEAINVDLIEEKNLNEELDLDTVREKKGLVYDESTRKWEDTKNVVIRSAWNFASIARYSRESNNGIVRKVIRGQTFLQQMNIDYTKYRDGRIYDGNDNNRVKVGSVNQDRSGSSYIYGNIPILLDRGTYEGNNKTIKNIYLSNDSSANRYVGLFGSVLNGSKIHDLYVENVYLNAAKASTDTLNNATNKYEGVYMGVIAAYVDGNSEIMNVHVKNAEFDLHKVPEIKEVNNNNKKEYDWNYDPSTVKIKAIGGIVGELISGKVENSDVDTLSINLNSGKYYYKGEKKDSEDEARNTLTEYTAAGSGRTQAKSVVDPNSTISIGGAIGEIDCSGTGARASVTNVTVIDPTITANRGKDNKVGGFVGSVDGTYSTYASDATTDDTRPAEIKNCGVYISEGKKDDFTSMGVIANGEPDGRTDGGDKVGGFAGYLGLGANVTKDYSAIRVQGIKYVGGFAGHIKGSHVENCYSGGYVKDDGTYDTTDYNVEADTSNGTAGGFVGKIEVAYQTGSSGPMAMYMTGINYTTSSVSGKNVGLFAGDGTDDAAKALAEKMGNLKPTNYAGGKAYNDAARPESTVKIKSAMPRKDKGTDFKTIKYNANKDTFPFDTNLTEHHGDWVEYDLMTAGYWELEDGKLRIYYIPSDVPDSPQERMETGCAPFDHDGRHTDATAKGITAAGYFAAWANDSGKTYSLTGNTSLTEDTDIESRIQTLLGGSTITVKAYDNAKSASASLETWQITGGTASSIEYYVNPAYGRAIEIKGTTTSELGTEKKPYEIRTAQQLDNADGSGMYFRQTHDVAGKKYTGYTPNNLNGGEYDGGSYRILDLKIDAGSDNAALFSALNSGARVVNTILYGTTTGTSEPTISGKNAAGIAATIGNNSNTDFGEATIENCAVAGYKITGTANVGGLVATVTGGTHVIKNSQASADLMLNYSGTDGGTIGGLVGNVGSAGKLKVQDSYAGGTANVNGDPINNEFGTTKNENFIFAGGIVGKIRGEAISVTADPDQHGKEKPSSGNQDTSGNYKTYYYSYAFDEEQEITYDNVYSFLDMYNIEFHVVEDQKFREETESGGKYSYSDKSIRYNDDVIFSGIGPNVNDRDANIGYWDGGMPDKNVADRERSMSLLELADMNTANKAEKTYIPDNGTGNLGLTDRQTLSGDQKKEFPFKEYVQEDGKNVHYGAWPEAASYAGIFYYEKESGKYNFYAYGIELVNGTMRVSEILDTLCKERHLDEVRGIDETGYGYFVTDDSINFSVTGGTSPFTFDEDTTDTIGNELITAIGYPEPVKVMLMTDNTPAAEQGLYATYKDLEWTLTTNAGSFGLHVIPAFGGAIYGDEFIIGTNDDDHPEQDSPFAARTPEQFMNITKNHRDGSVDYYIISHDINFSDVKDYTPGPFGGLVLDGQGYRLFNLNITTDGEGYKDSKTYSDEFDSGNTTALGAALFTSDKSNTKTLLKNIVLYAPKGDGEIKSNSNSAAGIVVNHIRGTIENCVVAGYTITGAKNVGGITAESNHVDNKITDCEAVNKLVGTVNKVNVGGIVGIVTGAKNGSIQNCYSGGTVDVSGVTDATVGGIYGSNAKDKNGNYENPKVKNSYTYMGFNNSTLTGADVYTLGKNVASDSGYYYYGKYADAVPTGVTVHKQGTAAEDKNLTGTWADNSYWPRSNPDDGYEPNGAMGRYPFRAVAYIGDKDDPDMYVHYGEWPNDNKAQAAGVAYYEKDSNGKYSVQIVGYKSNDGSTFTKQDINELCTDPVRHVDAAGNISTEHQIVESGYAAFTTKPGTLTVGGGCDLTGIGAAVTGNGTVATEVSAAIDRAVGIIIPADGIKVYPTGKTGDTTDMSAYNATVTAGGNTRTVYYTNGFAGVSTSEMGTSTSQIKIRTVRQLDNIPNSCGKYFQQTHDLYGEDYKNGSTPKYTGATGFSGHYDGGSYRILELSMSGSGEGIGLFNTASGTIENVIMYSPSGNAKITNSKNVEEYNTDSRNFNGVGGIVGKTSGSGLNISNSIVAGYKIYGCDAVGGILGYGYQGADISNCAAVNDLYGTVGSESAQGMGGIVGISDATQNSFKLNITNCYAGGTINKADSAGYVGGIIGFDAKATIDVNPPKAPADLRVQKSYSYVNLKDTGASNVNTIGGNLDTNSKNNYYLKGLYPASYKEQGTEYDYFEIAGMTTADNTADRAYAPDTSNPAKGLEKTTYPFPAVVNDYGNGNGDKLVHYGALPEVPKVNGAVNGIFYWEKHGEDYHVQAIAVAQDGTDANVNNLCTNRDGTGVSESGFGYFTLDGTAAIGTNHGDEIVDADVVGKIKTALGVHNAVKVHAYKNGTTAGDEVWSFTEANGTKHDTHVNPASAKVTSSAVSNAYEIRSYSQLALMNLVSNVKNSKFTQAHDIDASASKDGVVYTPATLNNGSTYDGGGYRILELTIKGNGSGNVGLFESNSGQNNVEISNVVLYSPSGTASISDGANVGGILGAATGSKKITITNCVVAGYKISGTGYVGGIVGDYTSNSDSKLTNCQAVNDFDAGNTSPTAIGGIAGRAKNNVENCYAGGRVINVKPNGNKLNTYVGGIYGQDNSSAKLKNCYSYMDLSNVGSAITDYNNRLSAIGDKYSDNDCYYLKSKFPTSGTNVNDKGGDLTAMSTPAGFDTADSSYAPQKASMDGGVTGDGTLKAMTDNFPYPAVFTPDNGGTHEHYGTWLGTISGAPGMPEGPSFEGMMSAAVPEGLMPEVLALPVNELAGEAAEEETEETLPPDTPDAIKPEEFTLPEPESTDDNGDDGHTEIIDIRVSVARVRRVR